MTGLTAGAAVADITPPIGTPMDGYGARQGVSIGVRDPLTCRVAVLDDGTTRLAVAVCDLLGVGRQLVALARAQIAANCGIAPSHVLIAGTHTHAGPAGMRGRSDPELMAVTARKVAGAVEAAMRAMRPAVLKIGEGAVDSVSLNRRDPSWPVDPTVTVLQIDQPDSTPIATVVSFACHATVMNYDNLLLSADYPGAAARTIEREVGGTALVFNGACANVNPVWMRQEFDEVERVGRIVGAEAARVAQELRPLGHGQRAHNIRWDELTEKPVTRGELVPGTRLGACTAQPFLNFKQFLTAEQYEREIASLQKRISAAASDGERRELAARRTMLTAERTQLRRVQESGELDGRGVEIQAIRLGDGVGLLGLPGEWFVESARAIRATAGYGRLLIICYANDYPGYLTPPPAYPEGGYEAGMTPFTEDAEPTAVRAALGALAKVR